MIRSVFLILLVLLLSHAAGLKAQTAADSSNQLYIDAKLVAPDYQKLYDYSKMGDTVITEYGNMDGNGSNFYPKTGAGLCCFAIRRITVRKGKLKEVYVLDSNTGFESTTTYDEKGKSKTTQRVNNNAVRNAPPYR
jgi:antitoxin component YwqK of YwqJK toxin-antitoxin module